MPTIEKPLMKCDIINYLYSWLSTKFQIPKILKTNEMSYVNFLPYLSPIRPKKILPIAWPMKNDVYK